MRDITLKTPNDMIKAISKNVRTRRKMQMLSMARLSELSGVSYGSIRRFEETGEVSLKSLIKIAIVLDCADDFKDIFKQTKPMSIQEIIDGNL